MKYKIVFDYGMGTGGADLLQLEGSFNIHTVHAVKREIQERLGKCQALQVVVKNAEVFDFSFLQVLLGLKIKFMDQQKPICFVLDIQEENKRILMASGMNDLLLAK